MQRRPEVAHAVKAERQILPDCMVPDGGEPCRGFYAVYRQLDEYRKALTIAEQNLSRENAENARLTTELADARHDLETLMVEQERPVMSKPDKYRVHPWINTETLTPLWGVQARIGPRKWAHAYKGKTAILYDTEERAIEAVGKLNAALK